MYHNHPAYDAAIAHAMKRAATIGDREGVNKRAEVRVWYHPETDTIGVSARGEQHYDTADRETVALVRFWGHKRNVNGDVLGCEVECRERGAMFTFKII